MSNSLARAIDAYNHLCDEECDLMFEIAGEAAFDPFDGDLHSAAADLICNTAHSLDNLSSRARRARINLIWKDFVTEQKQKRAEKI